MERVCGLDAPMPDARGCVAVLGFFDGMHLGHRALMAAARAEADRLSLPLHVFTFADGTGIKADQPRLSSEEDRCAALLGAGASLVVEGDFRAMAPLSAVAFVDDILIGRMGARAAFCGFNFRFGRDAAGDAPLLRRLMEERGREAYIVPAVFAAGEQVSSGAIRAALAAGEPERAAALLGRPYTLTGMIEHGRALGRTIGCPTVNLHLPVGLALPRFGVYAGFCRIGTWVFRAVTNLGVRPTVSQSGRVSLESHLLDCNENLYGQRATVAFLRYLREERRFDDLAALEAQIARDTEAARSVALPEGNEEER